MIILRQQCIGCLIHLRYIARAGQIYAITPTTIILLHLTQCYYYHSHNNNGYSHNPSVILSYNHGHDVLLTLHILE